MRISDWSSDVCSSDLYLYERPAEIRSACVDADVDAVRTRSPTPDRLHRFSREGGQVMLRYGLAALGLVALSAGIAFHQPATAAGESPKIKIGRASCRERVCQYVLISVVARSLNKNKHIMITYGLSMS